MNDKTDPINKQISQLHHIIETSENIVFLGGAGVSTGSGIPDFRSENGIYRTTRLYGYPPEKMLSRTFFQEQTIKFYDFYKKELVHQDKAPNDAHYALARLEEMGKLKAIITQNIDGLHQKAGSQVVLELHGSIYRNYCMACHRFYELSHVMMSKDEPRCLDCGGIVKPDVVLYEEGLDDDVLNRSVKAIEEADVLIIGGTSLNVYPAAGLIRYFNGNNLVLINKGETPYDQQVDVLIRGDIGKVLDQVVNSL